MKKEKKDWRRSDPVLPAEFSQNYEPLVFVPVPKEHLPASRQTRAVKLQHQVRRILRDIGSGMNINEACKKHDLAVYTFNRHVKKEQLYAAYKARSLVIYAKLEELDNLLYTDQISATKHEQLSKSLRWQLRSVDPEFSEKTQHKTNVDVNVTHGVELPAHIEESLNRMTATIIDVEPAELTK